jgi:hypothetical protein
MTHKISWQMKNIQVREALLAAMYGVPGEQSVTLPAEIFNPVNVSSLQEFK